MPIYIPDQHLIFKIIGIDPGLNHTGISVFDIDYQTNSILKIEAFTLSNDRLKDYTGLDFESHSDRTIKLYKLRQAVVNVLSYYNPVWVTCEAPFYNRFRPMAFGALLEVVNCMYSAVIDYNPNIQFHTLAPMSVKKIIGARAVKNNTEKGKFEVKTAILNVPEIMNVLSVDINTLSEHAIDAIAVGYTSWITRGT